MLKNVDFCHSHRLLPVLGRLLDSTYTDTGHNMLVARRALAAIFILAPPPPPAQLVAPATRFDEACIDVMLKDSPLADHPRYSGLGPLFCTKPVSNLAKRTTWDIKGHFFGSVTEHSHLR